METHIYETSGRGLQSSGNQNIIVADVTQKKNSPLAQSKPNLTSRHFKALMLKNALIWRRTWFGSSLEIICPILLMLVVCYGRYILQPTYFSQNLSQLQVPIYPPTNLDSTGKNWTIQSNSQLNSTLAQFLNYTGYPYLMNTKNSSSYFGQYDIQSFLNFYPQNCKGVKSQNYYSSPIIGYVKTGNQIEKDVVSQLTALFSWQKQTLADFQKNKQTTILPAAYQQFLQASKNETLAYGNFTLKAFDSTDQLFSYISADNYGSDSMPAICYGFKILQNSISDYELEMMFYDIAIPTESFQGIPSQVKEGANISNSEPDLQSYSYYVNRGYSFMQNLVANTILKRTSGNLNASIAQIIYPMKTGELKIDPFTVYMKELVPLFLILTYVPLMYRTTHKIVSDKTLRTKETMKMMGLSDFAYWSSWYTYYTIINTIISAFCTAILRINVYQAKSCYFLFIIIWLFGQSLYGIMMMLAPFFSTPRPAAIVTSLVYMGTTVFSLLLTNNVDIPVAQTTIFCLLFPTVSMSQTIYAFIRHDQNVGVTLETVALKSENITVQFGIFMLILDNICILLLGIYLDLVMPRTFGERKHPLFFLGCRLKQNKGMKVQVKQIANFNDEEKVLEDLEGKKTAYQDLFEPVGREELLKEQMGQILHIKDLTKLYDNGFKAVDGLNLKCYSDQIFVLLGHNGAGKTSTISMLSGLYTQTQGTATLFGMDLFENMDKIRQTMGICPQYDVQFDLLSVEEHLSLYYELKGGDPNLKKTEIDDLMKGFGVYDKKDGLSCQLSGGNKRKLSVALALCGASKFVFLDEPTSGMDLSARRQLWNMLKSQKKNRIILLTTHFMDEADILGDRIGIMSKGKISCVGSSMFLKNKFGIGYNMTAVKTSNEKNEMVYPYIQKNLGENVILHSEIQSEISFQIPHEYSEKFSSFFQQLDKDAQRLEIKSYGVSISTLEEVFIKVGQSHAINKQSPASSQEQHQTELDMPGSPKPEQTFNMVTNLKELDESFMTNLIAIFYQKFSNFRRNKKAIAIVLIIPSFIMAFGIVVSQIALYNQSPSRILEPSRLPLPQSITINPTAILQSDISAQSLANGLTGFKNLIVSQANLTAASYQKSFQTYDQYIYQTGVTQHPKTPYMYGSYQIYQASKATQQYKIVSFINTTSQDATALYPQFMYESILKAANNNPNFSFKVRTTPYPLTNVVRENMQKTTVSTICFLGGIAFGMILTAITSDLVIERAAGLKHLQLVSGMKLMAFWSANFLFDFCRIYVLILVSIAMFAGYNLGYTGSIIVLLIFPFAVLPFTYVISFIFPNDNTAQAFTMFIHFFFLSIGAVILGFLRWQPNNANFADTLNYGLKVIPTYMFGSGLYCDATGKQLALFRSRVPNSGKQLDASIWGSENITMILILVFAHFVFWFYFLFIIEKGYFQQIIQQQSKEIPSKNLKLDDDVFNEAVRVHQGNNNDVITVKDFKKVFSLRSELSSCKKQEVIAVNNLNFGLQAGECFALLGVNGAGKSTTFKSLIHELNPTSGNISVAGYDLSKNFEQARKFIGYCPQPNLVFDSMTTEEHLIYYSMIKGIPRDKRQLLVEEVIQRLQLQDHRKKPAGTLSGGTKRKICVGQALIGNPPIILLDEPSAGMDPEARRFMWNVVQSTAQNKTSAVVLTTHGMDEAEALSTKMGIMVKGGIFKCFGSSQHIKNKFGQGYIVEIKLKTPSDDEVQELGAKLFKVSGETSLDISAYQFEAGLKQTITTLLADLGVNDQTRILHDELNLYGCILEFARVFKKVDLIEKFGNYMKIRVEKQDHSIGVLFGVVEMMKDKYEVLEYSVGQTTLEQIFQQFADEKFTENVQEFILSSSDDQQQAVLSLVK